MRDRVQFAIRTAALERVRDDMEIMLDEAELVLFGLENPASRRQSNELALLQLRLWWMQYRDALAQNLGACDRWADSLRSSAVLGAGR